MDPKAAKYSSKKLAPAWAVFVLTLSLVVSRLLAQSVDSPVDGDKLLPVPDAEAQRAAMELVKSVFREDFDAARDDAARRDLARRVFGVARRTEDTAQRFVLLKVSRDIAAAAGDAATALSSVKAIEQSYQVDGDAMRMAVLLKAAKATLTTDERSKLADLLLEVSDAALARDQFEVAQRLLPEALTSARRAKDIELIKRLVARNREFVTLQRRFADVKRARAVLRAAPQDGAANLVVGKYVCFTKGDWDRGLPYLALSSDAKLKELATRELATPASWDAQIQLGDGWWDLAQEDESPDRRRFQKRAAHWYTQALDTLPGGLVKLKIEQRLQEVGVAARVAADDQSPEPRQPKSTSRRPKSTSRRPKSTSRQPKSTSPPVPVARDGTLQVFYKRGDSDALDNQIKPQLQIANLGTRGVPFAELTIRYWYTNDGGRPQKFWCDWAQLGTGSVQGSFHRMQRPARNADTYLEIGFADDAPAIRPGGQSGPIQLRFAGSDWSKYDESNDYSFDPDHTDFAAAPRITLYREGDLVWGSEPEAR